MDDSIAISEQMYYYRHDHLGNNVAVWNAETNNTPQRTLYYASGVPMAQSWGKDRQPYLYNGKEFIEAHGLNEYDSQARMHYAPIMRTTTMDPMAEKYYHISPYAWCGNNPMAFVDPEGMVTIFITGQLMEDVVCSNAGITGVADKYTTFSPNQQYRILKFWKR